MPNQTITFQMATHPLPKIALRLESLLKTIDQASQETHPIIHRYGLQNLLELLQLIQKPGLKSQFLKELIRIEHAINKADYTVSSALYARLYTHIHRLNYFVGPFGNGIDSHPFLQSIQQNQPHLAKDWEETSPQLVLWLEASFSQRQNDLSAWLDTLTIVWDTISLYLALVKNTAVFETISLSAGFYQRPLPPKSTCHLILLRMNKDTPLVPQMQIGHHGLSLRLLDRKTLREAHRHGIEVEVAICQV